MAIEVDSVGSYRDGSIDVVAGGYLDEAGFTPVSNPVIEHTAELLGHGIVQALNTCSYVLVRHVGQWPIDRGTELLSASPRTERIIGKTVGISGLVGLAMVEIKTGVGRNTTIWATRKLLSAITPNY